MLQAIKPEETEEEQIKNSLSFSGIDIFSEDAEVVIFLREGDVTHELDAVNLNIELSDFEETDIEDEDDINNTFFSRVSKRIESIM